ncbi:MAG: hypothetical protein HY203_04700 [Nitrospirae bacterium]|nr:hypothetical protein [Nitrospirota bacterium]
MKPLNLLIVTWSLAIFSTVTFLLCVLYGLIAPESLHMHEFLEIALPGFKWGSLSGFFVGLLRSFIYGAYTGLVYVPIYNFILRRWE